MGKRIVAAMLVLAACGSAHPAAKPPVHGVSEYASVIAEAKLDITSLQTRLGDAHYSSVLETELEQVQGNYVQYATAVAHLESALRAVGAPDRTAATIVPETLARLKKITAAAPAATSCRPAASKACIDTEDVFFKAFSQMPRIWASWAPYLG